MNAKAQTKRKNIFIKKKFQTDFSIKFLILIVIESLMAIGLFIYLSRGTIITGYSGSEVIIANTSEYFLPTLLLTNLVVIGVTAAAGFIVLLLVSHKIAGPLYRFERSLEEIGNGDLTYRFTLRSNDQMGVLAEKINEFNAKMENAVSHIKLDAGELNDLLSELQILLSSGEQDKGRIADTLKRAIVRLDDIKKSANYFKISKSHKNENLKSRAIVGGDSPR